MSAKLMTGPKRPVEVFTEADFILLQWHTFDEEYSWKSSSCLLVMYH